MQIRIDQFGGGGLDCGPIRRSAVGAMGLARHSEVLRWSGGFAESPTEREQAVRGSEADPGSPVPVYDFGR